ncbi:Hypothetical protein D9617_6g093710 [Elsinoe fawcettii]|nr:Hypothetical protein D9617_6g093710 [Elsinoe fawcettii]
MATLRVARRWISSNPIARPVCHACRRRLLPPEQRAISTSPIRNAEPQYTHSDSPATPQLNPFAPGIDSSDTQLTRREKRRTHEQDPGYVPAKTIDGLEWVGTKKWVEGMRDQGDRFEGWSRKGSAEVHSTNVGKFLKKIQAEAFGGREIVFDETSRLKVQQSVAKFTGIRISDLQIQGIKDIKGLRRVLIRRQREPKFSQVLGQGRSAELQDLPNVAISGHRVTMYDKENQRGRWKIMEQALRQRGLPVFKKDATKKSKLL